MVLNFFTSNNLHHICVSLVPCKGYIPSVGSTIQAHQRCPGSVWNALGWAVVLRQSKSVSWHISGWNAPTKVWIRPCLNCDKSSLRKGLDKIIKSPWCFSTSGAANGWNNNEWRRNYLVNPTLCNLTHFFFQGNKPLMNSHRGGPINAPAMKHKMLHHVVPRVDETESAIAANVVMLYSPY